MNKGLDPMAGYQFALLRYTANAAAGEFANIGVAMWLPQSREFLFALTEGTRRLSRFFAGFDESSYLALLRALRARFDDWQRLLSSPTSALNVFSVLLPEDPSIGWGPVMFGVTCVPARRLSQLFDEFVGRHQSASELSVPPVDSDIPWAYREAINLLRETISDPVGAPWWVLRADEGEGCLVLSEAGKAETLSGDVPRIEAAASELWETNPLIRELLLPLLSGAP